MKILEKLRMEDGLQAAVAFAAVLGFAMLQSSSAQAGTVEGCEECRSLARTNAPCDWHMIAPNCLPKNGIGVFDHYTDDHSGKYCKNWGVFKDVDGVNDAAGEAIDSAVRLEAADPIEYGEGYWMCITQAGVCIDVDCSEEEKPDIESCESYGYDGTPGQKDCFAVDVQNTPDNLDMIGHPFPNSVAWNMVKVVCDDNIIGSPADAEAAGILSQTYYTYNVNAYASYTEANGILESQTGYWVRTLDNAGDCENIKLIIPSNTP